MRAIPPGDGLLADLLADEFDLDLRLGEVTATRVWTPMDAQTDGFGCLPTGGQGAGTTCNTLDDTCAGTCAGLATCPPTGCGATCENTCPPTACGATCEDTCPQTACGATCDTCPFTGCGDTCVGTCATCDNSCHPPCATEGINNTCDLMISCVC